MGPRGAIDANPCPLDGPPSAWIEIATAAFARLPIAARSVMQGPHAGLVAVWVSTTCAPAARRMAVSRAETSSV